MKVICALLICAFVACAAGVTTDDQRWSSLQALLQFSKAELPVPLRVNDFPETGRGVASTHDQPPGTLLFRVPSSLAFSASDANHTAHGAILLQFIICSSSHRCCPVS